MGPLDPPQISVPHGGTENGNSVPGCSLQYGLDLTVYLAVIDDPVHMSSKLGCEVHAGIPQNMAGQPIIIHDEEEKCLECLGSYSETFHAVECTGTH